MLKGDVSATPLPDVLTSLAEQSSTGCLHIDDEAGDEALVYFKNGLVYAAYVPGRRPQLGARLISSGALAPEALAEALEAQETELQGWRLGELLVHLGYVERGVVEAFVLEQLREAAFDLSRWQSGRFRFRKNEKTREDVGSHAAVADLLAEVERRRGEWEVIAGVVHGPGAVPVLSAGGLASAEMTLDQDQWALLCKVDGERTIAQLARDCGFTTFEAGQIVYSLVGAGLLDVEETIEEGDEAEIDTDFAPLGAALASALTAPSELVMPLQAEPYDDWVPDVTDEPSEIARLLGSAEEDVVAEEVVDEEVEAPEEPPALREDLSSELASLTQAIADLPSLGMPASLEPEYPEPVASPEPEPEPAPPVAEGAPADPFGDSLARVSEALSALLGDALPAVSLPEAPKPVEPTPEELEAARLEAERLERSRAAAAAELAEAHAMAEAARQSRSGPRFGRRAKQPEPTVDDVARQEAERAEAERVESERVAAEEAAEAARAEAERVAAEEAARVEAERLAEAERQEAERVAAAEEAEQAAQAAAELAAAAAEPEPEPEPEVEPEPEAEPVSAFEVASYLRDLNDSAPADTIETVEEYVPDDRTPADPDPAAANGSRSGLSETAALLRELTSLGLDDEPAAQPPAARSAAKATPKDQQKKRKGLFGRG